MAARTATQPTTANDFNSDPERPGSAPLGLQTAISSPHEVSTIGAIRGACHPSRRAFNPSLGRRTNLTPPPPAIHGSRRLAGVPDSGAIQTDRPGDRQMRNLMLAAVLALSALMP